MADKGDLNVNIFKYFSENKTDLKTEIPFKFHGDYSKKELEIVKNYMHSDFPHLTYGGGRNKEVLIEYPPEEICSKSEWKNILETVFLPEYKTFNPKLLRSQKIIVRFEDKLFDDALNLESGGNGIMINNEELIRISTSEMNVQSLTFVLMHELAETDFWSKTFDNDKEAQVDPVSEINAFKSDKNQDYMNLLDEKVANRRAMRAIQRKWPDANYQDKSLIYDEDK